jgi:hypothetical protein
VDRLHLDETTTDRFRSVTVDIGYGRTRSLHDLIVSWHHDVQRLRAEADAHRDDDSAWTPHDLVGALFLRDHLESGLRDSGDDAARATVDGIDEVFRSITTDAPAAVLPRIADVPAEGRQWWWRRIPVRGPVAEALRRPGA